MSLTRYSAASTGVLPFRPMSCKRCRYPPLNEVKDIEELIEARARREVVEQAIERLYNGEAK